MQPIATRALALAVAGLVVLATATAAQTSQTAGTSTATLPRTADGRPDLNGIWQALSTAAWNLEAHNAQKNVPAGLSVVVGGEIPYRPQARAQQAEHYRNREALDPVNQCYLPGVPRITYMPYPFRINQTRDHVGITYEYSHAYRMIFTNGTEHPEALEFWMGDSRGHWEDDVLVVSVADFIGDTWFDQAGNFHTAALRVTERYAMAGPNHIMYEATIDDPDLFTRPWTIRMPLYRRLEDNAQTLDYECLEFDVPFMPWDEVPEGLPRPPAR